MTSGTTRTLRGPRRGRDREPVQALPAGTLLPISQLGTDGTIVLEDGSFSHVIACYPRNLQTLTADERFATFLNFRNIAAFQERGQSLQLIVEGDRVKTEAHLAFVDEQIEKVYGFRPSAVSAAAAVDLNRVQRARWGLYEMLLESVRRGAVDADFTPRQRVYIVVRYQPEDDSDRSWREGLPAGMPGSRASRRSAGYRAPRRGAARRLRDHQQLVRLAEMRAFELIGHLARDGITGRILDGPAVLRYVSSRLNPTSVSWDRTETLDGEAPVLSRFDDAIEGEDAERAALALRDLVARSPLDFRRYSDHAEVEQDLVQVLYLTGAPSMTRTFWMAELMNQPLPYTLTVHLHGLDRAAIADEAKRLHHQAMREVEREARKGRRDATTSAQAQAHGALAEQMAQDPLANLTDMSVYLALRAPGPRPDKHALAAAAYRAQKTVARATSGGTLDRGNRLQEQLWVSTLPFGADVAHRTLRVGVEHAADSFPLIGSTCGSPSGIPLFIEPVSGQVQYLNPFDRALTNSTIVIAGRSGVGKTVTANRLVAQMVAMGAHGFLYDRAGHYELLADLIPGARVIRMGADDGTVINHWDVDDPGERPEREGEVPPAPARDAAAPRADESRAQGARRRDPHDLQPLRQNRQGPQGGRARRAHARLRRLRSTRRPARSTGRRAALARLGAVGVRRGWHARGDVGPRDVAAGRRAAADLRLPQRRRAEPHRARAREHGVDAARGRARRPPGPQRPDRRRRLPRPVDRRPR